MTIRTNNKEFRTQVRNHVIDCLDTEYFDTIPEQLQNVMDDFNNYNCAYERKRFPNKYDNFKNWLNGLPSSIHNEFSNYNIYMTLKSWFENCGTEYVEQDAQKEFDLYYYLFIAEFEKLCKQYDVKF